MTAYLPVWHSHCTRARYSSCIMQWWANELAVISCPLLCLQRRLRKLREDC